MLRNNAGGTPLFYPNFNKGFDGGVLNPSPTTSMPWLNYGMLRKVASTVTTRSNVFAVWLTVGFFEVVPGPNGPTLGQEINKAEGRNVRHRMFAILDRSSLSIGLDTNNNPLPGKPGPAPFFVDAQSPAVGSGQPETITLPLTNGTYEDRSWSIGVNTSLVVDSGQNQEVVTVTAVGATSFTAVFKKPHPTGFAVSNAMLGHPGPQPFFDPRNPAYSQVVRYFSIIQ